MHCPRGRGYSTKFYTGRLRPEVQPLTLWNTVKFQKMISPGAYLFQRPFLRGLFWEGPIFGRAYVPREICIIKSVGLSCSGKEIYHFCFVLLCTWGQILSTSPLGGLYSEGRFNGGFFTLRFWGDLEGLMHGGAYFRNFTVPFWQKRYPALSSTFFWQNMVPLSHT